MKILKKIGVLLIVLSGVILNIVKADTINKIRTIDFFNLIILGFGIGIISKIIVDEIKNNK